MSKIKCLLGFHNWDKYQGYFKEKPHPKAVCKRCEKKYKEVR